MANLVTNIFVPVDDNKVPLTCNLAAGEIVPTPKSPFFKCIASEPAFENPISFTLGK